MNIKFNRGVTVDFKDNRTDLDSIHFSYGEVIEDVTIEPNGRFSDIYLPRGTAYDVPNSAFDVMVVDKTLNKAMI